MWESVARSRFTSLKKRSGTGAQNRGVGTGAHFWYEGGEGKWVMVG